MKKIKKLTSAIISLMMVCTSMGGFALWSSADNTENVKLVLKSGDSLSFLANAYTLNGKTVIYTGKIVLEGTLENGFTVENGEPNIVFNGVTINNPVVIKPNTIANIEINGENTVTAKTDIKGGKAGINVPEKATLNLSGKGTLTVTGSDDGWSNGGAGIGGNNEESAGTINIKGGIINATAGQNGAGIGGGDHGAGGNINIEGGEVTAAARENGSGIGGGFYGDSGDIKIKNATVTAIAGIKGSGIGGGNRINNSDSYNADGKCKNITIDNSTVTAIAGKDAEPIGGGNDKKYTGIVKIGENIVPESIRKTYYEWKAVQVNSDNTVTQNGKNLSEIEVKDTDEITLEANDTLSFSIDDNLRKTYTYKGKKYFYKKIILKGTLENGFTVELGTHNIVFNGVTINDSVVIKPITIVNIDIEGTNTVTAKTKVIENSFLWFDDTVGKAGINVLEGATLNLSGKGTLTTKGSNDGGLICGDGGAAIGGNYKEKAGTININEGTIIAIAGEDAEPIGGGDTKFNSGVITINGTELDKSTRETYKGWKNIKVNPDGTVEKYTEE